jgi:putative tricarboxylic transport membrane protein
MERASRQLRNQNGLLVFMAIFSSLFLMSVNSEAADPSADYPSRPIEFIAPSGPGSAWDVVGRLMSDIIEKEKMLTQPMVVLNKPGALNSVGMSYVFEKKGSPYAVIGVTGNIIVTPLMVVPKLQYNYKSFSPIANLSIEGSVLAVKSDSPFKTIDDLIAEARKRPKELTMGGGSLSSHENLMSLSIQKLKGVKWNFISFLGGDAESITNLLGGNVHFIFISPVVIADHVTAGKVRVLLAGASTRFPQFKNAPTFQEAGLGEPFETYRGIIGPPNMPDYAVRKLEGTLKKVIDSNRFKEYLRVNAILPKWMTHDEYSKFLDKENDRLTKMLTEYDLLPK